jgi:1H-pyrrole-2-carbonyl-[peptidyl-carrier protein] chlorinase
MSDTVSPPRVVVIGGGPAGSTTASYLRLAGVPCRVYDAVQHPRAHVGESLVPSTTRVLREIGFLPTMERVGFIKKFGAAWHPPGREGVLTIEFGEFPQPGVDQPYTYQVDRGLLDELLLRHAQSLGAEVVEEARVREVMTQGDRVVGVVVDGPRGREEVRAEVVVDASGRKAVLGRQLGFYVKDPVFDQFAVHAWFEGVDRGPARSADFIHIYFLKVLRGWAWQIPITPTVTSMGVVAERAVFRESKLDPEGWFHRWMSSTPDGATAMASARRVNEFKLEADYSYSMTRLAGEGFLLVGDAARFVDPIFSSGVSVAMEGARAASRAICAGFAEPESAAEIYRAFEARMRSGVSVWYEFIRLYYRLMPQFTYFLQSPKHRHQALQLLQGEVYERDEVEVLDAMRRFVANVEKRGEAHPLAKNLDRDVPID